jgi:hypothetical protein
VLWCNALRSQAVEIIGIAKGGILTTSVVTRRPGVVTFVGVVLYIKAALAAIVGIALLVEKNNSALLDATGRDGDYIVSTAIGELILAVLLLAAAWYLMSGAKGARLAVAIVVGLRMVVAVWWMITHFGGALNWHAIITVGIGIFVLWALYGNQESDAYFEGHL